MPDAVDGPAAAVADDIAGLLSGTERVLVGITGPPGGGKTTITRAVIDILGARRGPDTVAYVPMDGFHLSDRVLADIGRGDRKGAPDTFDADGFVTLLERITACGDRPVYCPDFDHVMGEPIAARLVVAPTARVIVVEATTLLSTTRHGPRCVHCYAASTTSTRRVPSDANGCYVATAPPARALPMPPRGSTPSTNPTPGWSPRAGTLQISSSTAKPTTRRTDRYAGNHPRN
ncbi:hypothetical protein ACIGKQ_12615 [Gordonia sp. NPDC062954]|uniref:hypothetical protein n=1 Tax=Gordonia sp. NPDC062954 TaxID=3364003 RepID=UPI0037CBE28D